MVKKKKKWQNRKDLSIAIQTKLVVTEEV